MAICKYCNQEMLEAPGCVLQAIRTVDGLLDPVQYGKELDPIMQPDADGVLRRRCGDCAALPGNYHHIGCDIEECPRCHTQLISCDCMVDDTEANGSTEIEIAS